MLKKNSPQSLTSPPEWGDFPSSIAYRSFEATIYYKGFYGHNASGITDAERLAKVIQACKAFATRSCTEYEGEYFNICEKITGKPVIPIGLLLPEKLQKEEDQSLTTHGSKSSSCLIVKNQSLSL